MQLSVLGYCCLKHHCQSDCCCCCSHCCCPRSSSVVLMWAGTLAPAAACENRSSHWCCCCCCCCSCCCVALTCTCCCCHLLAFVSLFMPAVSFAAVSVWHQLVSGCSTVYRIKCTVEHRAACHWLMQQRSMQQVKFLTWSLFTSASGCCCCCPSAAAQMAARHAVPPSSASDIAFPAPAAHSQLSNFAACADLLLLLYLMNLPGCP